MRARYRLLELQSTGGLPVVRDEGNDLFVVPGVRLLDDLPAADVEADVPGVAVADLGEDEVTGRQPVMGSTATERYMILGIDHPAAVLVSRAVND